MTLTAIDCQSFAGSFSLGVIQAGFELIAKREMPAAFGAAAMEANRHLLGDNWELQASDPDQWKPLPTDLVFGNPPCSGFSLRSSNVRRLNADGDLVRVQYIGVDAALNQCMRDLVAFAAKCDPKIVIFESVQGAFTKGRSLMQELRNDLQTATGDQWNLFHVLHNVKDLGGAQDRPRYFWVAARIPFGVTNPHKDPATVFDRIGDLENVPVGVPRGSVEGHFIQDIPRTRRLIELGEKVEWNQGERSGTAYARAMDQGIEISWTGKVLAETKTLQFSPRRLKYDAPSNVLVRDALNLQFHPTKNRTLTFREIARLTGLPDEWIVQPYSEGIIAGGWFGKGICVEAGQWIAEQAFNAINGNPGEYTGESGLFGDNEFLIDMKNVP